MDAKAVTVGSVVRVKPGERIGLDGEIVQGRSSVNQAPITGESLPVDKAEGDAVFAGTINESGSFDYRVTAAASNTTLARIIHAVEEAQGAKAPTQRFVDQFARVYTPIVFAIALMVAATVADERQLARLDLQGPGAAGDRLPVRAGDLDPGDNRQRPGRRRPARHSDQGRRLSGRGSQAGVAGTRQDRHHHPRQTGTDRFRVLADLDAARCRQLAASLAGRSDHPVSQAVVNAADQHGIKRESVDAFEALPGRGVRGVIGGKAYSLGNHRLVHELERCSSALEARLDELERQGKTVVMLVDDQQVLALFAVADTVKDSSRAAIADLHASGLRP
jgi:Cd2+/Zn2+-exporting ATPase